MNLHTHLALIRFVKKLSTQLNAAYYVHPDIRIVFREADTNDVAGWCLVLYKRTAMYVGVDIPWNQPYTVAIMNLLTCLLTHEYAHYIWSLKLSPAERVRDCKRYDSDDQFRRNDEYRTWIHAKKMLKDLGYWKNPAIRKACLTFTYSSAISRVR